MSGMRSLRNVLLSFVMMSFMLGGTYALAQSELVNGIAESRARLKPFRAIYKEVNRVLDKLPLERNATPGWGATDHEMEVEASVDAKLSTLTYKDMTPALTKRRPEMKLASGGRQTFTNAGPIAYSFIEGGMRGAWGKHPSGMVNPAAAGYEAWGQPVDKLFKSYPPTLLDGSTLLCAPEGSRLTIRVANFGGQSVISGWETELPNSGERASTDEWVVRAGMRYPKRVTYAYQKDGKPQIERSWTLVKILDDTAPLRIELKEGALLKDDDANIVYDVKNGKLVPNSIFNKDIGRETTLRRIAFIGAAVALVGLGTAWWLRKRRLKPA